MPIPNATAASTPDGRENDQPCVDGALGETRPRSGAPAITIAYYTDPLCSWSWAFEPQWRRLRYEFGNQIAWRYHMGGMIADWQSFSDPLNSVSTPAQMGPQWFEVRALSGMPINERLWHEDPPASSYPACLAFKAAERQGPITAERYLRRMREAVMLEGRNIARWDVLVALAEELAREPAPIGGLDVERFRQDLPREETRDAFREDLKEARYRNIGRFPTLTLQHADGRGVVIVGYRPYDAVRAVLAHLAPDLVPERTARDRVEYVSFWGRITAREVAEACGLETESARRVLEEHVTNDALARECIGPGTALYYRSYQTCSDARGTHPNG